MRTREELLQLQALPLDAKIKATQRRINEWYEYWEGQVYVSFSGGKDSTVLKHIVDSMPYEIPSVFVDTGLEYPEIKAFIREIKDGKYECLNSNIEVLRPEKPFNVVVQEYGYPIISKTVAHDVNIARRNPNGKVAKYFEVKMDSMFDVYKYRYLLNAPFKISDKCCDVMKKKPTQKYAKETGRKPMTGTLATESKMRYGKWLTHGCNAFEARSPVSQPLSFWTEQDILEYLIRYEVPYASCYGEITEENGKLKTTKLERTGCMFCAFGAHLEKSPNRFEKMKTTHPKQWEYCMKSVECGGLGLAEVLDFINVKTGREND